MTGDTCVSGTPDDLVKMVEDLHLQRHPVLSFEACCWIGGMLCERATGGKYDGERAVLVALCDEQGRPIGQIKMLPDQEIEWTISTSTTEERDHLLGWLEAQPMLPPAGFIWRKARALEPLNMIKGVGEVHSLTIEPSPESGTLWVHVKLDMDDEPDRYYSLEEEVLVEES